MKERQHRPDASEVELKKVERLERSILSTTAQTLRFQDLLAVLMAIATLFSAYAAWKMAQVTTSIFRTSERPYVGVKSVRVNAPENQKPRLVIEYADFGHVPASDARLKISVAIDGQQLPELEDDTPTMLGVLSPQVPHFFDRELSAEQSDAVIHGKSRMEVEVLASYGDAYQAKYCYQMRFLYNPHLSSFQAAGGSDRCSEGSPARIPW